LHVAAREGYPELVWLLVQSSADIHARNNEGRSPLEEASVKGHPNTIRLLLLFELPFGTTEDGA
jgi:ankyrin repeat protein